jgi:SAM-dependent methyltransferase
MEIDDPAQAFAARLQRATLGYFDVLAGYLGRQLGFYEALATEGALTARELSSRTGTHERYVREWLEQQAVTDVLHVVDATVPAAERRYALPQAHARVLVERDDPLWQGDRPLSLLPLARQLPLLLAAFREGGGIASAEHDDEARIAQASLGRVGYLNEMARWIAAVPGLEARLRAAPPARVADLGCGAGWSAIALARACPEVTVDGFDVDPASVEMAREHARAEGVAERVRFEARDAADPALAGAYDLAMVFEALHDMPRPVEALRTLRRLTGAGGTVLVVDLKVPPAFSAPGSELDRFVYGWSVLSCLASSMSGPRPAGTGAAMRPDTLRTYAREAGFTDVEILDVPHDGWTFYRLS